MTDSRRESELSGNERLFAIMIAGVHGMDHLLKRVYPPLIPIWSVAFGFPLWQLGVLLGARTFGAAVGMTPMGHLSDRFDRRVLLPIGFGVMGVGMLLVASVPSLLGLSATPGVSGSLGGGAFWFLLVPMLAIGVGSSTVHPTGYPLISANVSDERKGTVLGLWGSASKLGDGIGPALVGGLLLVLAWDRIIAIFALLSLGYAVVLLVALGRFDTRPVGRDQAGPSHASIDGVSRRLPLIAVFAYFVVVIAVAGGVGVFVPEFITSTYGYSFTALGTTMGPESTASFYYSALLIIAGIAQLGTGRLADRFDERTVILGYLAIATFAILGVATLVLSPTRLFGVLAVIGITLYGMNPARDALVSRLAPADREGRIFGYIWTGALLGGAGAPIVVGYVGDVAGLRMAFVLLAGGVALSALPIALLSTELIPMPRRDPSRMRAD